MKLLDTSVFVYARGRPSAYREPCIAVLAQAEGERQTAVQVVGDVLASFPDPFPVTRREVEEAAGIVGAHLGLSSRDAIHAAVALTYGLEGIVSPDRAFDGIPDLARFDPLELAGS